MCFLYRKKNTPNDHVIELYEIHKKDNCLFIFMERAIESMANYLMQPKHEQVTYSMLLKMQQLAVSLILKLSAKLFISKTIQYHYLTKIYVLVSKVYDLFNVCITCSFQHMRSYWLWNKYFLDWNICTFIALCTRISNLRIFWWVYSTFQVDN